MANIYDRIIKEIIEPTLQPLVEILLSLRYVKAMEMEDKIQYTLEREGDHLKMLVLEDERKHQVMHLEFHVKDEDLGKVMLLKKGMLTIITDLPVLQYVVYLGDKKKLKNLRPFFKDNYTDHRFKVVRLKDFSYKRFLETDIPEAAIWAILADYEGQKPEEVIKEILLKIDQLSTNKTEQGQHVRRLEVLSNLRKLQPLFIKISNDMAFLYDLETDIRFKQGKDIGEKKGIEKGIGIGEKKGIEKGIGIGEKKGIEKGIEIAEAKAKAKELKKNTDGVTKMLKTGRFTDQEIVEFLGVTIDFVKKIKKELAKKKAKK
ncbi:MAG TPA: hypothetical protein ENJ95_22990 [Bacteroidetes bacterium]|nr:hypothetical protein [Bacteroidota bacterium]